MSRTSSRPARTLAFGDVDGGCGGRRPAPLDAWCSAIGDEAAGRSAPRGLVDRRGRGWRLRGDGFELHVEPGGEELEDTDGAGAAEAVSGFQELCRVHGRSCLAASSGRRLRRHTRRDRRRRRPASMGSAARVSGWFGDDEAFTLLALRRRRASGQESDLVAATLFDPEGWVPVDRSAPVDHLHGGRGAGAGQPGAVDRRGRERVSAPGGRGGRRPATSPQRRELGAAGGSAAMPQPRPRGHRRIRARHAFSRRCERVGAVISDFGGVLTSPLLGVLSGVPGRLGGLA